MCFKRLNLKPPNIAKSDIICYKLLRKDSKNISSPYRKRYKWKDKKIRGAKLSTLNVYSVSHGFHSFIEIKHAVQFRKRMYNPTNIYIYKMIIPKEAIYYKNKTQYVSNKIKLALKTPVHFFKSK